MSVVVRLNFSTTCPARNRFLIHCLRSVRRSRSARLSEATGVIDEQNKGINLDLRSRSRQHQVRRLRGVILAAMKNCHTPVPTGERQDILSQTLNPHRGGIEGLGPTDNGLSAFCRPI